MNILHAGNKRGFFTNSTGNLLPNLEFLGRQYNFCNLIILFNVNHDDL